MLKKITQQSMRAALLAIISLGAFVVTGCSTTVVSQEFRRTENSVVEASFIATDAHPLDIGAFLDQRQIALRCGHHCCMPLMETLNLPGTESYPHTMLWTRQAQA